MASAVSALVMAAITAPGPAASSLNLAPLRSLYHRETRVLLDIREGQHAAKCGYDKFLTFYSELELLKAQIRRAEQDMLQENEHHLPAYRAALLDRHVQGQRLDHRYHQEQLNVYESLRGGLPKVAYLKIVDDTYRALEDGLQRSYEKQRDNSDTQFMLLLEEIDLRIAESSSVTRHVLVGKQTSAEIRNDPVALRSHAQRHASMEIWGTLLLYCTAAGTLLQNRI
jgi:hypothetical protein